MKNLGGGTVFSILDLIKDVENGVYPEDLSGKKVLLSAAALLVLTL